ncbi:MAG TPA: ribonuclease E inhibitor RraB [Steroidobacteraceae bacterium]|nr:ribonuclease E inhibitor RraB [Steroidobacteraceae bacterium]
MAWFYVVLLLGALGLVVLRIYFKLRAAGKSRGESWDEQMVGRLRSQGYAPFNDYPVDFFLALPDEAAVQAVRARLAPEFAVDARRVANDSELAYSLHASKSMRLVVPDMQAISRRLTELATEQRGRYDGWAAGRAPAPVAAPIAVVLKRFETPDETRELEHGRFELVQLGGLTIGRATYQPGWKWSTHVGPALGLSRCSVEHVGLVLSGAATAAFDDGTVIELRAGQLFYIPPLPHDSWVLGDEPYVSLHFAGAEHYAKG